MELNELTKIMKQNGVVGAGGAGFPTYAKLDKRADNAYPELCGVRTTAETAPAGPGKICP